MGDEFISFEPEVVRSYETGLKLDMLQNRLRMNTSLYFANYDDKQIQVTRQLNALSYVPVLINVESAEIYGAELELSYLPIDPLLISFTGSYSHAEYKKFIDSYVNNGGDVVVSDRTDEEFSFMPEQTYSLTAQYRWETAGGDLTPRVGLYYIDEMYIGLDEDSAKPEYSDASHIKGYTLINARLAWVPADDPGLEVALYINNVADKEFYSAGNIQVGAQGASTLTRGRPRSYGLEMRYQW